jgi:uncharacterized membrane protein
MGKINQGIKISLLILLLIICPVRAATIHGTVYSWETLEPLPKTIITVNTTPEQQIVTEDGNYIINLTDGTYILRAFYYKDGFLNLYGEENVTIQAEGDYNIDLVLFPPISDIRFEEPEEIEFPIEGEKSIPYHYFLIPLILLGITGFYFLIEKKRKIEDGEESIVSPAEHFEPMVDVLSELPEDLKNVISIIRSEGGRITQKELRRKYGCSEAKMSLIIADLERRDIVEKVKKGRGNIIFLKNNDMD